MIPQGFSGTPDLADRIECKTLVPDSMRKDSAHDVPYLRFGSWCESQGLQPCLHRNVTDIGEPEPAPFRKDVQLQCAVEVLQCAERLPLCRQFTHGVMDYEVVNRLRSPDPRVDVCAK